MNRYYQDCWMSMAQMGAMLGIPAGGFIGFPLGGWLGAIAGALLGVSAGFVIGAGAGLLLCWLFHRKREQWPFGRPRFTNLSLSARPSPARVNAPCSLHVHWTVDGNTDFALCEITYEIRAEGGQPEISPPLPPIRNTGSTFGRASPAFLATWDTPHDGRKVEAIITLVATKDGQMFAITETVPAIRVAVLP